MCAEKQYSRTRTYSNNYLLSGLYPHRNKKRERQHFANLTPHVQLREIQVHVLTAADMSGCH